MTASVLYSQKLTGTTATTSVTTLTGFNFAAGDAALVMLAIPSANGAITAFTDNATPPNTYTLDHTATVVFNGFDFYFYRKSNFVNVPTTISVTATTGSFAAQLNVLRVSGLDNASPFVSAVAKTALDGTATPTLTPITTTNASDFVMVGVSTSNSRYITAAAAGLVAVAPEVAGSFNHLVYLADAGAAGAKSGLQLTFSAGAGEWMAGAIYKAAKPLVTTTGNSVTEGTALRFTLTMASNPGAITDYGYSWGGTAVDPTDYDGNLANATFSAGLSFTGVNIRFASGTTTGTIDVPIVDNALDQADRTLILTVGGVASTGWLITDNDAPPLVTFTDGVESFGVVTCVATLGAVSGKDVSFQVDTTNGTKTAGTNYTAIVAQTVTIPAGSLTAAITANTL